MKCMKEVTDKYVSTFFIVQLVDSKLNEIQAVLQTFMLAPLFFTNILVGMETKN